MLYIYLINKEATSLKVEKLEVKTPVAYIDVPNGFAEIVEFGGMVRWGI